jgi:hypothetical protein
MAKIPHVKSTLSEAEDIKTVWQSIPDFKMGTLSLTDFVDVQRAADELQKGYTQKDVELTGIRGNRDDKVRELRDLVARFRSGIKSAYGSNSALYEQAGCTRASARKAPKRKAAATTETAPTTTL